MIKKLIIVKIPIITLLAGVVLGGIENKPALFEAVKAGEKDKVIEFINSKKKVDIRNKNKETPLIVAAEFGHYELVEFFCNRIHKELLPSILQIRSCMASP